tara:strand:- start:143 stop:934 length:792 start_codon:yes stop_codon:yes gene_type:complete
MDYYNQSLDDIFGLKDKVAVVIGGGGHLCSSMARGLAIAGASIVIIDIRLNKAQNIANEINKELGSQTMSIEANITKEDSIKNALKVILNKFNKIDILINGAGRNSPKPFLDISLDEWQEVMDSQITGTMLSSKVFAPEMIKQRRGSIINISSASAGPPLSKAFAYSVAKAGITNLTMNLAREWAKYNVRVNAIRPGFFPTEWNKKNFITPEREQDILRHTPMNRYGSTNELIGATIWLASEASTFVTGSEVTIDGGFSCMTI